MVVDTLTSKMGCTPILSDIVSVKKIKGVCLGVGQCEYTINTAFSNLSEVKRRRGNRHSVHEIRKGLFICGRQAHFLCIKCVTQPFSFAIASTISTHTRSQSKMSLNRRCELTIRSSYLISRITDTITGLRI